MASAVDSICTKTCKAKCWKSLALALGGALGAFAIHCAIVAVLRGDGASGPGEKIDVNTSLDVSFEAKNTASHYGSGLTVSGIGSSAESPTIPPPRWSGAVFDLNPWSKHVTNKSWTYTSNGYSTCGNHQMVIAADIVTVREARRCSAWCETQFTLLSYFLWIPDIIRRQLPNSVDLFQKDFQQTLKMFDMNLLRRKSSHRRTNTFAIARAVSVLLSPLLYALWIGILVLLWLFWLAITLITLPLWPLYLGFHFLAGDAMMLCLKTLIGLVFGKYPASFGSALGVSIMVLGAAVVQFKQRFGVRTSSYSRPAEVEDELENIEESLAHKTEGGALVQVRISYTKSIPTFAAIPTETKTLEEVKQEIEVKKRHGWKLFELEVLTENDREIIGSGEALNSWNMAREQIRKKTGANVNSYGSSSEGQAAARASRKSKSICPCPGFSSSHHNEIAKPKNESVIQTRFDPKRIHVEYQGAMVVLSRIRLKMEEEENNVEVVAVTSKALVFQKWRQFKPTASHVEFTYKPLTKNAVATVIDPGIVGTWSIEYTDSTSMTLTVMDDGSGVATHNGDGDHCPVQLVVEASRSSTYRLEDHIPDKTDEIEKLTFLPGGRLQTQRMDAEGDSIRRTGTGMLISRNPLSNFGRVGAIIHKCSKAGGHVLPSCDNYSDMAQAFNFLQKGQPIYCVVNFGGVCWNVVLGLFRSPPPSTGFWRWFEIVGRFVQADVIEASLQALRTGYRTQLFYERCALQANTETITNLEVCMFALMHLETLKVGSLPDWFPLPRGNASSFLVQFLSVSGDAGLLLNVALSFLSLSSGLGDAVQWVHEINEAKAAVPPRTPGVDETGLPFKPKLSITIYRLCETTSLISSLAISSTTTALFVLYYEMVVVTFVSLFPIKRSRSTQQIDWLTLGMLTFHSFVWPLCPLAMVWPIEEGIGDKHFRQKDFRCFVGVRFCYACFLWWRIFMWHDWFENSAIGQGVHVLSMVEERLRFQFQNPPHCQWLNANSTRQGDGNITSSGFGFDCVSIVPLLEVQDILDLSKAFVSLSAILATVLLLPFALYFKSPASTEQEGYQALRVGS